VAHLEPARYLARTYPRLETVGLLGSGNDINVASTQRFCDQVASLPSLDKTRFRIAGNVCGRLKNVPRNVELLGNVESLHEFFKEIDLFVNPMVVGTGLKIKSVEALSYGVPFLSTDIGTEGIDVVQNYHRFATLSDLTLHLASLAEQNLPLEDYRVESVRCHQRFAQSVESQIDRLDSFLRRQTTGVTAVAKSDRLTSLA
jgi:polysaccharide biosynthesis protein PslH